MDSRTSCPQGPELAVIMPVYNEAGGIAKVLDLWCPLFRELCPDVRVHVYNDGSRDNTLEMLRQCAARHPEIVVHDKPNEGHGPTVLRGYRENLDARWIFQMDSDGELEHTTFPALWAVREDFDLLLGQRQGRPSPLPRKCISAVTRTVVRLCYGSGLKDVNVPYRLLRVETFASALRRIPPETFAPNVILDGYACLRRLRLRQLPVRHIGKPGHAGSTPRLRLFVGAARSLLQVVACRVRLGGV